jgi:hypothetical protein
MTETNHRQNSQSQNLRNSALDRELDAALAKLASVEPRAGLDERVLANLHIEQERTAEHSWWRWPAVAALAAAMVVSVFIVRRSERPAHNIAEHPPSTTQANEHSEAQLANHGDIGLTRPHQASTRRLTPHQSNRLATALSVPKLDQFPSPQPLSEQEAILARYVTNYPAQATLIAQARTEELRQDIAEEMGETASGIENSQQ